MNTSFLDYYNIRPLTGWIHDALCGVMPEALAVFLECVVIGVVLILLYSVLAIVLIYMERKVCAAFQCRIGPIVLSGTASISGIVESQANGWNIFKGHIVSFLAFIIYLIAGNAEANRGPFDLAEAEQELIAGYHTEYSGLHFGFFYLAEYMNLFITAGFASTLFLGGWMPLHISGLDAFNQVMDYIPGVVWALGKTFFVVWLLMWVRWTFPRLRIDQVLMFEWKYLMPTSLLVFILMVVLKVFGLVF